MPEEKAKKKFTLKTLGILTGFIIAINGLSDNLEDWYDRLFTNKGKVEQKSPQVSNDDIPRTRTVVEKNFRVMEPQENNPAIQSNIRSK